MMKTNKTFVDDLTDDELNALAIRWLEEDVVTQTKRSCWRLEWFKGLFIFALYMTLVAAIVVLLIIAFRATKVIGERRAERTNDILKGNSP